MIWFLIFLAAGPAPIYAIEPLHCWRIDRWEGSVHLTRECVEVGLIEALDTERSQQR